MNKSIRKMTFSVGRVAFGDDLLVRGLTPDSKDLIQAHKPEVARKLEAIVAHHRPEGRVHVREVASELSFALARIFNPSVMGVAFDSRASVGVRR